MLVDYRHVFFLREPELALRRSLHKCTESSQRQTELNWPQTHVLAPAALPLTCHVIKTLRSAAQASKAGLPLSTKVSCREEKKNSLTYSILSIYTSLYLPPSTYFPLLFNPLWPVPWHY